MDDPNIILTMTPADPFGLAVDSFRLSHNQARYVTPSTWIDDGPSRGKTPYESEDGSEKPDDLEFCDRIRLTFDQPTKVSGRFTFGTDPATCDVLLLSRRSKQTISGQHFHIAFDAQERLILQDVSTNGTTVSYDKLLTNQRRRHFRWILFNKYRDIKVHVQKDGLALAVHIIRRKEESKQASEYKENVKRFIAAAQEALPAIDNLALRSHNTSMAPSELLPPWQCPIYLPQIELGKGSFGCVYRVVDVSTGTEYAGKTFFARTGWEREIEIMRHLQHEYVVKFVDFSGDINLLVMEYMPLGNLQKQNEDDQIAAEETIVLMYQCLTALDYLHGKNITHRDIKPENILVYSRKTFKIKLADFGLAQHKSTLETFCGSFKYAAPEIYMDQHYSKAVDIWSLGVVIMEYTYGLPQIKRQKKRSRQSGTRQWGLSWCRRVIDAADDWESDVLIDFLTQHMLKWDPNDRLSAADCLSKGSEIGLFNGAFSKTGNVTPMLQPGRGEDIDAEEAPTTVMGPLWQDLSVSPRQEECTGHSQRTSPIEPQPGRFQPSQTSIGTSGDEEDPSPVSQAHYGSHRKRRRTTNTSPEQLRGGEEAQNDGCRKANNQQVVEPSPPPTMPIVRTAGSNREESVNFPLERGQATTSASGHPMRRQRTSTPNAMGSRDNQNTSPVSREPFNNRSSKCGRHVPADIDYFRLDIRDKPVRIRKSDLWVSATDILDLTTLTMNQRDDKLKCLNQATIVEVQRRRSPKITTNISWISFADCLCLCNELKLTEELKQLLGFGLENNPPNLPPEVLLARASSSATNATDLLKLWPSTPQGIAKGFFLVNCHDGTVAVRTSDLAVNINHVLKLVGQERRDVSKLRQQRKDINFEIIRGAWKSQGSYVKFSDAIEIGKEHGLRSVVDTLLNFKATRNAEAHVEIAPSLPYLPDNGIDNDPEALERPPSAITEHQAKQPSSLITSDQSISSRTTETTGLLAWVLDAQSRHYMNMADSESPSEEATLTAQSAVGDADCNSKESFITEPSFQPGFLPPMRKSFLNPCKPTSRKSLSPINFYGSFLSQSAHEESGASSKVLPP